MTALIDTHAFIWWFAGDKRLSAQASAFIADSTNTIVVSAAVGWEIAIKEGIGQLVLPEPAPSYVRSRIAANGFSVLSMTLEHTLETHTLPLHHRDPFDRIMVAQSQLESMAVITADPLISQYSVPIIW